MDEVYFHEADKFETYLGLQVITDVRLILCTYAISVTWLKGTCYTRMSLYPLLPVCVSLALFDCYYVYLCGRPSASLNTVVWFAIQYAVHLPLRLLGRLWELPA